MLPVGKSLPSYEYNNKETGEKHSNIIKVDIEYRSESRPPNILQLMLHMTKRLNDNIFMRSHALNIIKSPLESFSTIIFTYGQTGCDLSLSKLCIIIINVRENHMNHPANAVARI